MPHNQFKLTHNEIDAEIIVVDGGNSTSPPIKPPDDVLWRSISVNQLVEDDIHTNIGLTDLSQGYWYSSIYSNAPPDVVGNHSGGWSTKNH